MKINHRLNAILIIGLTLGFGFTIAVVSAAPPITVTSVVPDEAEQGTTNLTVIIYGRGFDKKMDVKFCRSETNETCVDGGVDVAPGSVRFIDSKKLEVIVDVGLEAIIGNFDIEAISLSSGRRGRGIEKFAVLKAGGGGSSGGNKAFLFEIASIETCEPVIDTGGESFGNVTWAGNVLWDPKNIHVHYKLQLKDVDPEDNIPILGNNDGVDLGRSCGTGTVDFPLCADDNCTPSIITVKQNQQGRTSGALSLPGCDPDEPTTVWVTVTVNHGATILRSTPVTVVLPPNEVGTGPECS